MAFSLWDERNTQVVAALGERRRHVGGTGEQLIEWPTELVRELTARGYRVDNRDVGLSTHMTDVGYPDSARAQAERNVDRAYDPAGLVRQQTVTLVDHLDPHNYRHAHLERITTPTAIVQGAADPLEPLVSAQDLAANIPGADLYVIPGLGHDVPAELAPLFVAAMP